MTTATSPYSSPDPSDGKTLSLWGEVRATVALTAPITLTMLGIVAIEVTDVLMIGRLGESAIAAGGIAASLWVNFLLFGMGVLNAVPAMIAQAIGRDDPVAVRRTARQGLWVGTTFSIPSAAVLFFWGGDVLELMGQRRELADLAQGYLDYFAWTLVPITWTVSLRLTMAAYEVTHPALIAVMVSIPINAFLNWLFIFGSWGAPELGLPGAGLASLIVETGVFLFMAGYAFRVSPFRELSLFVRLWRADWGRYYRIIQVGLPAGAISILEHSLFFVSTVMMGWVGVTELAAHNISFQIMSVMFMVPFGLSQAISIRIAHAAGRNQLDLVRRRGWLALVMTIAFMSLSAMIIFWGRADFIGLFVGPEDLSRDAIVATGAMFLGIAVLFQIVDGLQIVATGVLRGVNDTKVPMILGGVCFLALGIFPAYWLAFISEMGGIGIWLGLLVGLIAAAALLVARFWTLTRTPEKAFAQI